MLLLLSGRVLAQGAAKEISMPASPGPLKERLWGEVSQKLMAIPNHPWALPVATPLYQKTIGSWQLPPGIADTSPSLCPSLYPPVRQLLQAVGPSLFLVAPQDGEVTVLQNAFDPEQAQKPSAPLVGAYLKARGQRIFVAAVLQGSPASMAGVMAGDEVVSIQGKPPKVDPQGFPKGATQWVLRRSPSHLVPVMVPAPVAQTIDDLIAEHIKLVPRKIVTKAGTSTKSVVYAHLASTHRTRFFIDFKEAVNALLVPEGPLRPKPPSKAHKVTGLIIDLRGPFGPVGSSFAELLSEPNWFFGTDPQKPLRPVAVLVDETTLGGREWLAWMLKSKAGATLVGAHTGGMWASSQWLPLEVCPGYLLVPQGSTKAPLPEGIGLTPDVVVPTSIVYMSGADPVLEAAIRSLDRT